MRQTRTWLFAFLPVLYLAIVFGLIAVQFSKKSDTFSQSQGDLTLSGKTANGASPAELTVKGRGLVFAFDAKHVLTAETSSGTVKLRPVSWRWKDGNAVVDFQQGLQLVFEKTDHSLLIRPSANQALKSFSSLRIPFGAPSGTRLADTSRKQVLEVVQSKSRLVASVDGASDRIDPDRFFVLNAGADGYRPARVDPLPAGLTPELTWITLDPAGGTADAESALARWWDKAYTAWNSAAFSTKLVDAWGREALRRGDYAAVYAKIQRLQDQDNKAWGFDALTYLGNMVELTGQQRRLTETASSRSQPDWAANGRLWLDAGYYGPEGSADRVKSQLLGGDLPASAPALIAQFQNLVALQARQPSDAVTARVQEVLKALQTKVVRREGALFVETDGLLNLRATLLLGRLWMDYSRNLANEAYASAGAQLVTAALSFQDAAGKLPEVLAVVDGKIVRQEGTVLPEEVYASVKPAAPLETLLPDWGSSAFVRAASLASQSITAERARFTFRFPTGSAEHIILSGVPAFDHITLHGIRWRTDPQFQSYTDGWSYSPSTKTLYLKIKHRDDIEELVIHYQPE